MRCSVIIPNYNYGAFIGGAIQSVLNQSIPADEIIVVDDGSTDLSRSVIESFGSKIIPIFQENNGQASAISNGFMKATGDIILLLDSDDFFAPNKIEIIKELYSKNLDAKWVFHDLEEIDGKDIPHLKTITLDTNLITKINEQQSIQSGKLRYDAPATSGLSFRRDFMTDLFPLPTAQSIYISDHYIKFYALACGKGINLAQNLGGQLIHGNNLYTGQKEIATRAKIFVNTALALRKICPNTARFCNSLFVEGRASAMASSISENIRPIVTEYTAELSPLELLLIEAKTFLKTRRYRKSSSAK